MLEYIDELKKIRQFMAEQTVHKFTAPFPHEQCDHIARVVKEITGLEVLPGDIILKDGPHAHTCNYSPKHEKTADLARSPFGNFPDIIIEDLKSGIFAPYSVDRAGMLAERYDPVFKPVVDVLVQAYRSLRT